MQQIKNFSSMFESLSLINQNGIEQLLWAGEGERWGGFWVPAEHDAFSLLGRTSRGWFCNKAHHHVIVLFKGGGFARECEGGETGKEGGEELKTERGG